MTTDETTQIADVGRRVLAGVKTAVVGMDEPLTIALAAILAGGHVLFEDVPGLGKTLAARSLAGALGLDFRRLQCTPDMLPGDVTGSYVYAPFTGDFAFRPGPIFTGLLLADEINRTTPKTQSAMLEAMAEHQVTVEGNRFPLPRPFHVIATSNPIEYEGTYALPEAQLDRFMVRLAVGYPQPEEEARIILDRVERQSPDVEVEPVVDADGLRRIQAAVEGIHVDRDVVRYGVELTRATREAATVAVGASPRGSQALILLGRALAALDGRAYVRPDDLKRVAVPVLAHRLTLTPQAWAQGVDPRTVVDAALARTAVPPTVAAAP
ncbi:MULTISPECIES: AAA family ATPase [unclassified Microbacterium]|uniref:AAA family ATPase n=1 Tax=unclassified Microbacterium TaxID=2609290 RepID=UPI0021A553ED|nr:MULTISPECIES: MoxR family ATPase [unclassified Microbacterium]MCT1365802.1 MoxR family ATPase [Microbacterium sp. p3-SID131]MCT1376649.1 MoxR family ATPase [Microbacterium sp. p3-SID337]MDH5131541.1 MoxR family ATPase [Microbacterium sp. RD10]MDH5135180.1 MoxR family ATPase [Microbacterium sp. RD11]MDH5143490.1 MoxR family ATPase [Microbacterium sp. RD12]